MSANLDFDTVATGQNQKETTINDAFGQVDAAISESLDNDYTSGNVTLTNDEFRRNLRFNATNLSTARVLTVPAIKHLFIVDNSAGSDTLTVTRGATSVVLAAGTDGVFYTDGTTDGLTQYGGSGGSAAIPDPSFGSFFAGQPTSSQLVIRMVFVETITIPSGMTGSQGFLGTAANAQTDFDVQKNGSSVGTMRFAASGTVASFIMASPTTFNAGDRMEVVAPGSPDATASDLSFTFVGQRP